MDDFAFWESVVRFLGDDYLNLSDSYEEEYKKREKNKEDTIDLSEKDYKIKEGG